MNRDDAGLGACPPGTCSRALIVRRWRAFSDSDVDATKAVVPHERWRTRATLRRRPRRARAVERSPREGDLALRVSATVVLAGEADISTEREIENWIPRFAQLVDV